MPLLVSPVAHQILIFWVTRGTFSITLLLRKVNLLGIITMRRTRQLVVNFVLVEQMKIILVIGFRAGHHKHHPA